MFVRSRKENKNKIASIGSILVSSFHKSDLVILFSSSSSNPAEASTTGISYSVLPLPCSRCCDSALPISPTSLETDSRSVMLGSMGGEEVCRGRKKVVALPSKRSRVEWTNGKCFYALIARYVRGVLLCLRSGPGGIRIEASLATWGRRLETARRRCGFMGIERGLQSQIEFPRW